MKTKLTLIFFLMAGWISAQSNITVLTNNASRPAWDSAINGMETLGYDGSTNNYVRLDMTKSGGVLVLTNNATLWCDNLPSSVSLKFEYTLIVASLNTNVYTISFYTNQGVMLGTNWGQPLIMQTGWTVAGTDYDLMAVGTNVVCKGYPTYYHR